MAESSFEDSRKTLQQFGQHVHTENSEMENLFVPVRAFLNVMDLDNMTEAQMVSLIKELEKVRQRCENIQHSVKDMIALFSDAQIKAQNERLKKACPSIRTQPGRTTRDTDSGVFSTDSSIIPSTYQQPTTTAVQEEIAGAKQMQESITEVSEQLNDLNTGVAGPNTSDFNLSDQETEA